VVALLSFGSSSYARIINFAWDQNQESDLAGYKLYNSSNQFLKEFGLVTTGSINIPDENQSYTFKLTAFDGDGNESDYSIPVTWFAEGGIQPANGGSIWMEWVITGTEVYSENFESYIVNDNPLNWLDTAQDNSMVEDDSLFKIFEINNNKVLGTSSNLTNIHSHLNNAEIENLSKYTFTGKLWIGVGGGLGLTFFSQYPISDSYYRMRSYGVESFQISEHPHGQSNIIGVTNSGVVPIAETWYQFKIFIEDTGSQTDIKAKIWEDGTVEPINWQIDCYDSSADRYTKGKIGVWSMSSGNKYIDNLKIE